MSVLPYLKKKYLKYESYKEQTIGDIFTREQLGNAIKLEAYEMHSSVFINSGNKTFTKKPLPTEAQLSPMYGIAVNDFDHDGKTDIVMGGNFYESKPEVGIYDASYGVLLQGDGRGNFTAVNENQSGMMVKGAVRDIVEVKSGGRQLIIFALNNEAPKIFDFKK